MEMDSLGDNNNNNNNNNNNDNNNNNNNNNTPLVPANANTNINNIHETTTTTTTKDYPTTRPIPVAPNLNSVAGISPRFWSYVRMSVLDVLSLELGDGSNGINWMRLPPPPAQAEFVCPVSRCLLVGYVVCASQRRDGSVAYVIDDGTGFIDCVHWFGSSNYNNPEDIYNLPSLSDGNDTDDENNCGPFTVGEPVRVYGKIECCAVTSTSKKTTPTSNRHANDGNQAHTNNNNNNDKVFVVREIRATLMERVVDSFLSESRHWMIQSCSTATSLPPAGSSILSCLEALGTQIRSQIESGTDLPAADDTACSWRVFGTSCRCNLPHMEDLLYCHCQSEAEATDPSHRFRDALLLTLLSMQSSRAATTMLRFNYKEIKSNNNLRRVAFKEVCSETRTENNQNNNNNNNNNNNKTASIVDALFFGTFRALRHDGILCLLNSNTDEYLLISKSRVLEPFVLRTQMFVSNNNNNNTNKIIASSKPTPNKSGFISYQNSPPYIIARVHNERLLYIKRLLMIRQEEEAATTATKSHRC